MKSRIGPSDVETHKDRFSNMSIYLYSNKSCVFFSSGVLRYATPTYTAVGNSKSVPRKPNGPF